MRRVARWACCKMGVLQIIHSDTCLHWFWVAVVFLGMCSGECQSQSQFPWGSQFGCVEGLLSVFRGCATPSFPRQSQLQIATGRGLSFAQESRLQFIRVAV